MRGIIEASMSQTLFTLDISIPSGPNTDRKCEVIYSAKPEFFSGSNGRLVISHQQAEQIVTAIGCILAATSK